MKRTLTTFIVSLTAILGTIGLSYGFPTATILPKAVSFSLLLSSLIYWIGKT